MHLNDLKIYLFFFFILITSSSNAQVIGRITDKNKKPVFANVFLMKATDSAVSVYTQTDELGYYSLKIKESGDFYLSVKSLSYTVPEKFLKINKKNEKHIFNFILSDQNIQLDEIFIKSIRPIKSHNDTITINAKSFATGNENVIEDLMKKIPGLFVSSDGVIKYNNQEIEKVMIEGDDFFEKGYRILTKNMTAKPIDKIQVLLN